MPRAIRRVLPGPCPACGGARRPGAQEGRSAPARPQRPDSRPRGNPVPPPLPHLRPVPDPRPSCSEREGLPTPEKRPDGPPTLGVCTLHRWGALARAGRPRSSVWAQGHFCEQSLTQRRQRQVGQ